jgi:3-oxoacyl-(acyl-carrier-protein) synthase
MLNFIKNREPAATAAFFLALTEAIYAVFGAFGYKLATGQWQAIMALLILVSGWLVRGTVTPVATAEAAVAQAKAGAS